MEHGKNRFFNICEAYSKMLDKNDSISSDARRYRNINESLEGYSATNVFNMWCEAFKNKICIIVQNYGFLCYGDGLYGTFSMSFLENIENYTSIWIEEELSSVMLFDSMREANNFLSEIPQTEDGIISDEWLRKYFPGTYVENVGELRPVRVGAAIGGRYGVLESAENVNNKETTSDVPESFQHSKCKCGKMINESYDTDAYDNVYIGRTDDYYSEEENDGVYSKPTWTWSEDANDPSFASEGPVYKLTDDGKRDFFEWLDAYQVGYSLGSGRVLHGRNESPEEEWDSLTNPGNGLSTEVVGSGVADESVLEKRFRRMMVLESAPQRLRINESMNYRDLDCVYAIICKNSPYNRLYRQPLHPEEGISYMMSCIVFDPNGHKNYNGNPVPEAWQYTISENSDFYRNSKNRLEQLGISNPTWKDVLEEYIKSKLEKKYENVKFINDEDVFEKMFSRSYYDGTVYSEDEAIRLIEDDKKATKEYFDELKERGEFYHGNDIGAGERYREQLLRSIEAGGSDPYGDAEYAAGMY